MGKGLKYGVMEDDLTLGGEHTMQHTGDVSQNRTLETYVMLFTNVSLVHLIQKEKIHPFPKII